MLAAALTLAVAAPAVSAAAPARAAATPTCSSTPFRSSPAQHRWYRLPAVVSPSPGVVLAFAERRLVGTPAGDHGDTDLVMTRSTDAGCRWSAPRTIAGANSRDRIGDPVPVVDTRTHEVLLFSVDTPPHGSTAKGLHLQRIGADGRSVTAYAAARVDVSRIPGWRGGLTGPGHAIQLHAAASPHPGRIVVPLGFRDRAGHYGSYNLLSDDDGRSFTVGDVSVARDHRLEGTVAELPDGDLWISYRRETAQPSIGRGRVSAVSRDGGSTLATGFTTARLPIVPVEGSALVTTGSAGGRLLFSAPGSRHATLRRDMTIFVSSGAGLGTTFSRRYAVELQDTPASYSDLVQLDDRTVGIVYETGVRTWKERIAFVSVRIGALTSAARVPATVTQSVRKHVAAGARSAVRVRVAVHGAGSPPGVVRVRIHRRGFTRVLTRTLTYSNRGVRSIGLPALPQGGYSVRTAYSGTSRIAGATTGAVRLRVG